MLKIENVVLPSPQQWEAVIRGMRNPKNSWDMSDSHTTYIENTDTFEIAPYEFFAGEKDIDLMRRLANAGTDHRKFMRMIPVFLDITAPLYLWKEFDTYKVGTVANSCSTMHKIQAKEFTIEDFSTEHLMVGNADPDIRKSYISVPEHDGVTCLWSTVYVLSTVIEALNANRKAYLETKDKRYWWQMIQLLPSSYNQKRTVMLNYEVLANIYKSRRTHKLDEWHTLCDWIEELPYHELICGSDFSKKEDD